MNRQAREEKLEGIVEAVVYRSDDGKFSVVRMRTDNDEEVRAVGGFGELSEGETLRVFGRFTEHATHGRQFRANSFTPILPTSAEGLVRFLGSGLVNGVGPSLAKRLVAKFGAETLDVITQRSAKLREVDGIGARRAEAIAEAVRGRREEVEAMAFLQGLGMGPSLARKLIDRYGLAAPRHLRDDPYLVAEEVRGIGFRTADALGRALGIASDDPRRAAGAALHLLAKAADDGHLYLELSELVERAESLGVPGARVREVLPALAARDLVLVEGHDAQTRSALELQSGHGEEQDAIYPPPLLHAERRVAKLLAQLAREAPLSARERPLHPTALQKVDEVSGDLSDEQRGAVLGAMESGLLVLTGGPGTGKTTTVRALVAGQVALGRRVLLAAPTGRAAKRLTEATGVEAKTIHRLLEWSPVTGRFQRNPDNPLDAELILVDEASMVDLLLAEQLLAAIPASSRLVLVGDVDQLPPVGPGPVLRELLTSGVGEVVRLSKVFRQAEESAIVRGAHAVLRGDLPEPTPPHTREAGDLFIVKATDAERVGERLLGVLERIAKTYGLDARSEVQILAPMRRGPVGTEHLNRLLQNALNPNASSKPDAPPTLAEGDRVMQLKNNYDKDVFNGDLGLVRRVVGGNVFVEIDGREIQFKKDELDLLSLAYATTIHKVQGSEFPAVVIILHAAHHVLLNRALLYTALTRGKKLVVLLGDPRAMARAARNDQSQDRNSRLARRLRALAP